MKGIRRARGTLREAKSDVKSVDAYITARPREAQAVLRSVRNAIRKALGGTEEMISYGIPTYKLDGRPVIYFAGWKRHYSLYPATPQVVAALGDDLAPYEVVKGTIRFPLAASVPVRLIARIAKLRAAGVAERARARRAGSTRRR